MLRVFPAFLVLLLATTASAQDWRYEDQGVPIAYFDNGDAQFQFACRGGDLAMGFWVRAPHREVAGASAMNLAITADPPEGTGVSAGGGTRFAQDIPLIHSDGSSMIVRGPVARQWARIAQQARNAIQVAYVRTNKQGKLEVFDSNSFGAKGSSATIKKLLDRCG
ncbi:hypothetical protein PRN20_11775 [Devosia sp. ZB163]|uniref:hypothetical protein n=1 Tax=Devosia sp. ZB163 TaxID=3025938 RepID=UPI0023616D18|nr:hypothetical protein [Devosia sp. ZB163]MDC9824412.1 hypothetical protein [Devosia sp. ZB163]